MSLCCNFARPALQIVIGAALLTPSAYAQQSRGELLYAAHCVTCHTQQMHWRVKRVATDWDSLKAQVQRWQGISSLGWNDRDVTEVTRYLNDGIYKFVRTSESRVSRAGPATDAMPQGRSSQAATPR